MKPEIKIINVHSVLTGQKDIVVEAEVYKDLMAVHPVGDRDRNYKLTHIPSGGVIIATDATRVEKKNTKSSLGKLAKYIVGLGVDLDFNNPRNIPEAARYALGEAVKAYRRGEIC